MYAVRRFNCCPIRRVYATLRKPCSRHSSPREPSARNFIKLEIHPDPKYLLPDPVETLKATEQLAKMGFVVLPYIQADPVLCKRLEEAGAATVMPLAAPIGTNKGLVTRDLLAIIIEQSNVPVIVDAGLAPRPMRRRRWRWVPTPYS